jgi:pimeloyl-ACP methyl ester carboxylesterase
VGATCRGRRVVALLVVAALAAGGCSTDGTAPEEEAAVPTEAVAAAEDEPADGSDEAVDEPVEEDAAESDVLEGHFDVGGHRLYLHCAGTGSPTVIYLHGSIEHAGMAHRNGMAIQQRLRDDHRFCVYDRRNVGLSDTVDAVQTPEDALHDLDALLEAAEVAPPYVLLGASFGGVLSYLYANRHPDRVVGVVLLDAMFPDEMLLEDRFPPEERFEAFDEEDENDLRERISHYKVMLATMEHLGEEPAIPLTYLASSQERRSEPHVPGYDEEIYELLQGFVDRFSPGELVWVNAPHFMEIVAASEIAAAIREVIAAAES